MYSVSRPILRSPALRRVAFRRQQSTAATKAAEVAKDTAAKAKEYQAIAAQGLSRVVSTAGPVVAGAAKGLTTALGKMGGPTGRVVNIIEKQTPFVVYYSKVAAETAKLVFHGQKMSPPSMNTFQTYYQNLYQNVLTAAKNGTLLQSPQTLLQKARTLSPAQLAVGGVVAAECLGFFTVGEMIGRFKLVGYRGETAHH